MEELPAKRILTGLLSLSILFIISSSYTLDGDWQLTPQHLNYTSSNPNTTFAFRKKIVTTALQPPQDVLGGPTTNVVHKGTSQLTVHACRTLTYNYYINENSIYLQKVNSSGQVRPCLPKELQELEWKLNSTFTFAIQKNQLVLFSPSNTAHLVLNRTIPSYFLIPPSSYSQWRITSINGSNFVDKKEQIAYINYTHAELCNFQGLVNYTTDQNNILRVNVEKDNCKNSNITKLFKNVQFEIKTQRKSIFFDKQLNQIGTVHFDRNINRDTFNALKNQAAAEILKTQNQGQSQPTNSLNTVNNNIPKSTNNQNQTNNQTPKTNTQGNIQPKTNTSVNTPTTNTSSTPKTDTSTSTPKTNTSGSTPQANTSGTTPKTSTSGTTPKTNTQNQTPKTSTQNQTPKKNNQIQTQTPKTNNQTQTPKTNIQGNVQLPTTNIQGNTQNSIQGRIQPTQSGTPKTNTQSNTPKTNTSVSVPKTNTSASPPQTNTSSTPKTNTSTSTPKTNTPGSTPQANNQTQIPKTNTQTQTPKTNIQGNNQGAAQPSTINNQPNTQNIQIPPRQPQTTAQGNTKSNSVNHTNQQSQPSNSNSTKPSMTQTSTGGHSFFLPYKASSKVCKCNSVSGVDALQSFDKKLLCNKWFLYAINGSDHNIDQYYYYFLIITPERMIYYGGCEVRWSPYVIDKNVLSGIGTSRFPKSQQQCIKKNIDNQVLQPFFDQVKYVDFAQNQDIPYILFYDKDLNHLATFHTETPNFPPVKE